MTGVKAALWCALLLGSGAWRVRADHHSKVQPPYQKLVVRGNTTAAGTASSSSSLQGRPITLSNIGESGSPWQSQSPSQPSSQSGSAIIVPDASFTVSNTDNSFSETTTIVTTTSTSDGRSGPIPEAGGGWGSNGRVLGDTFIASITTYLRPPLTVPPLASKITTSCRSNSTGLTFPTLSLNTTKLNTTTTPGTTPGAYTNSSASTITIITTPPPNTSARLVPISVEATTDSRPTSSSTKDACTTTTTDTVISYSIIHTWTITWIGDPADYTPPFPTISTPNLCTPTDDATGRFTLTICDSSGKSCSLVHTTAAPTAASGSMSNWEETSERRTIDTTTITFVTTDKNPAVVFPSSRPPDYGGEPDPAGNIHSVALPDDPRSRSTPNYGNSAPDYQNVKTAVLTPPPRAPITVIVKPTAVIIDGSTFTDNPAQPTSTVVVGSSTFVIKPTEIDGAGATITRLPSAGRGGAGTVPAPRPATTRTTIGGIAVEVGGSSVVTMDSTAFTVGPKPTAVVVKSQTITLGPGGIVFPTQTLLFPPQSHPDATRVVFGAELITAIGSDRVVIRGTTINYPPGPEPSAGPGTTFTSVIDGETVLIGPWGVVVDGKTYGGREAEATDSEFVVVGGATISQVGPTEVVIEGVTYTLSPLGPGQTTTTTVVGGETITIGPDGVVISTWTLASPYASTTVIMPTQSAGDGGGVGAAAPSPSPTAPAPAIATDTSKKNSSSPSATSRGPGWELTIWVTASSSILGCLLAL